MTEPQLDRDGDPFDDLLNLEDQYYTEGYNLGVADGTRAGRIEGRIFGLDKGFEKFVEMGRLGGKAGVWEARLPDSPAAECGDQDSGKLEAEVKVPALIGSERLRKHVLRLTDLTDPETLAMENSEDAVSEFDDRLKDAKAKATLISKIVEEDEGEPSGGMGAQSSKTPTRSLRVRKNEASKASGEMEDFRGLPGPKRT